MATEGNAGALATKVCILSFQNHSSGPIKGGMLEHEERMEIHHASILLEMEDNGINRWPM